MSLTSILPCVLAVVLASCLGTNAWGQEPDNVLFVLMDDVGRDHVGAYGLAPDAGPTPFLDELASRGVLFETAVAPPTCSPARLAILTGRHPFRTGVARLLELGVE